MEKKYCRPSPLNYTEVRIGIQNWDSATFVTYILQILLSELLDVPTSIETSFHVYRANFYDESVNLQYGYSDDERALNRSSIHGDCVPFTKVESGDDYLACSHFVPETWNSYRWTPPFVKAGILEPIYPMGELGREGWHIPRFTAETEPSMLHWTGLAGEANRKKLAAIFKRPVTYEEYCNEVSIDNCATPDEYASRPPNNSDDWYENELWRYFWPGAYNGYFRYTERNNCTLFPENCTGHIVDFPCGWSSYTEAQAYHLGIALESNGPSTPVGGYWEEQMDDIWRAANATRNHVIMHVAQPVAMTYEFLDGDYSFERVALQKTTQACTEARRPNKLRCSENRTLRLGDAAGACDEPTDALQKIFSTGLYTITQGPQIPEVLKSPAYAALRSFTITDQRIGEMFTAISKWQNASTRQEIGLREVVCDWVVDNVEFLEQFVPPTYPRTIESTGQMDGPVVIPAIVVSGVALVLTIVTSVTVYVRRNKPAIRRAKIEFLALILIGLLLVALGSMTMAIATSDAGCVTMVWLTNLGYSLELVPLVVKLAALNRLLQAGRQFRRVVMQARALYLYTAMMVFLVVILLACWTAIDMPQIERFYTLEGSDAGAGVGTVLDVPEQGGFLLLPGTTDARSKSVVVESYSCRSDKWDYWWAIFLSWQVFLLLIAAVLAFQNRNFRDDMVESRTLGMMIYSHLLFTVMRGATFILQNSDTFDRPLIVVQARSLLNSVDVISTLSIYFLPKLVITRAVSRTPDWGNSQAMMSRDSFHGPGGEFRTTERISDSMTFPYRFEVLRRLSTDGAAIFGSNTNKNRSAGSSNRPSMAEDVEQDNNMPAISEAAIVEPEESGAPAEDTQSFSAESSTASIGTVEG